VKQSLRIVEPTEIAQEVLAYLAEHPRAQDTLEGIVQWWLLEQEIQRRMAQVRAALAELVARGLVLERQGKDGRTYYRVNRRRLAQIRELLKSGEGLAAE
jgi:hypothetical protein